MNHRVAVVVALVLSLALLAAVPASALQRSGEGVLPLVVDDVSLETCGLLGDPDPGMTCPLWLDDAGVENDVRWANLDLWDVDPASTCTDAGSTLRSEWVANGYPDRLTVKSLPASTFLCADPGHSSRAWQDLFDSIDRVSWWLVNDCERQVDAVGDIDPCPDAPDKFAAIGFERFRLEAVYKGDDPIAIGTPATPSDPASPGLCGVHVADPDNLCLVVAAGERYRPDGLIGVGGTAGFRGNDVYGNAGGQTLDVTVSVGTAQVVQLRVENDGRATDTYRVICDGSSAKLQVRYFRGGADVTGRVTGDGYRLRHVPAGWSRTLKMRLRAHTGSAGSKRSLLCSIQSSADPSLVDRVAAAVRVRPKTLTS